jgi:hypothetical protein
MQPWRRDGMVKKERLVLSQLRAADGPGWSRAMRPAAIIARIAFAALLFLVARW